MKDTLDQVRNGLEEALKSPGIEKAQPGLERYLVTTLQDLHDYITAHPAPRGDLSSAQQVMAALWPVLNVVRDGLRDAAGSGVAGVTCTEMANAIESAQKELAPLYAKAMGDDVPEPKPTTPG